MLTVAAEAGADDFPHAVTDSDGGAPAFHLFPPAFPPAAGAESFGVRPAGGRP